MLKMPKLVIQFSYFLILLVRRPLVKMLSIVGGTFILMTLFLILFPLLEMSPAERPAIPLYIYILFGAIGFGCSFLAFMINIWILQKNPYDGITLYFDD